MPRKNRKGASQSQRRSHFARELERIEQKKKRRDDRRKGTPSVQNSHKAQPQNKAQPQKNPNEKQGPKSRSETRGPRKPITSKKTGAIVEGRLDIHPNGFAFVVPISPDDPHVYIKQGDFREYMNRDRVKVRITQQFDDGKVAGTLQSLVEHLQKEFIGTVRIFAGGKWVIPFDARDRHLTFEIASQAPGLEIKNNQSVLCKIIEYPSKARGKVAVEEEIDHVDQAHNDTLRVLLQASWPRDFSRTAVSEAELAAKTWQSSFGSQIKDLTHIPFVTIDGADARDFDDAVCAKRIGNTFELWVAIADVSRFVNQGTRLDEEAYQRSTSAYFPDHVVPMLPEVLSNGSCSLNPNEPRACLACKMIVDESGEFQQFEFVEGVMKSQRRMTYEEFEEWKEKRLQVDNRTLVDSFTALDQLTQVMLKRRKQMGGLDLDIPEARVYLNADGSVRDIQTRQRLYSHKLIEECMLAANRAAATFLRERGVTLYRVHEKPNPRRIEDLKNFLALIGVNQNVTLETSKDFAKLLEDLNKVEIEEPKKRALHYQILRTMAQARYSSECLGHFALNEENYTHFTSPIRRYPDLIVHRLIRLHLEKKKGLPSKEDVEEQAHHTSDCERMAVDMERKLIDIKKARYMEKHIGETFTCFVTGVTEKGLFCQVKDHYVDGLLENEYLSSRKFFFDGALSYRGPHLKEISYGTELLLRVERTDVAQGRVNFGWPEATEKPEHVAKVESPA